MLDTLKNLNSKSSQKNLSWLLKRSNDCFKVVALILIRAYQVSLSPILGGACRFHPTCSCYGMEAFQKHNVIKASALTLKRIWKCRPLGPFGFDPVPESKKLQ